MMELFPAPVIPMIASVPPGLTRKLISFRINRPLCSKRSEEHTSELQSRPHLVCRLLLEKKNTGSGELESEPVPTTPEPEVEDVVGLCSGDAERDVPSFPTRRSSDL